MMRPQPDNQPLALDFDSMRERLAQLASEAFPQWSDHEAPTLGNVLLDLYAYVADVLGYYIAAQGREARLATAVQRDSVLALSAMLGYRPSGATAAQAEVVFNLGRPKATDVVVPGGYEVKALGPLGISFRLLDPVRLAAGQTTAAGTVEASSPREEVFDAANTANLNLTLNATNYLDRSAKVTDSEGRAWTEVTSLIRSSPNDRHFSVQHTRGNQPICRFGNGTAGRVPSGMLRVSYKTGGGTAANVGAKSVS